MVDGLRWVQIDQDADYHTVRGMNPGWPEMEPKYYKLQWLDTSGFWRDVEIDE